MGLGVKFVSLKGLMGLNAEAPALAGAFLSSVFSIADWVKLLRNVDLVCFV
jgi:hypothetical protein